MATQFRDLLGTDHLSTSANSLLSSSLAPSTYANYDNALRPYFAFCAADGRPRLHATPATMVRYTAWLGLRGTARASSICSLTFLPSTSTSSTTSCPPSPLANF
jgi:hypothetical protein